MSATLQRGVALAAALVLVAALGWTVLRPAGQMRVTAYFGAFEIPWWSLLLTFSLLPAWQAVARRRARARRRHGRCPECGYDLRASPERCPECGTAAAAAADPTQALPDGIRARPRA